MAHKLVKLAQAGMVTTTKTESDGRKTITVVRPSDAKGQYWVGRA